MTKYRLKGYIGTERDYQVMVVGNYDNYNVPSEFLDGLVAVGIVRGGHIEESVNMLGNIVKWSVCSNRDEQ